MKIMARVSSCYFQYTLSVLFFIANCSLTKLSLFPVYPFYAQIYMFFFFSANTDKMCQLLILISKELLKLPSKVLYYFWTINYYTVKSSHEVSAKYTHPYIYFKMCFFFFFIFKRCLTCTCHEYLMRLGWQCIFNIWTTKWIS